MQRGRGVRRATSVTAGVLLALVVAAAPAAADGVPIHRGDLFISTGTGKIRHFDANGMLLDTLNVDPTSNPDDDNTGVCFTPDLKIYTANYRPGTVTEFGADGKLVAQSFGSGFHEPESCVVDAHGDIYVSNSSSAAPGIVKLDATGQVLATYPAAKDDKGVDWIDLAGDQCTIFYTSESNLIKRYNVCTSTQLPDFATGFADFGLQCFELRIRPNGEVMVTCTNFNGASSAYRLDGTGKVIQTYPGSSLPGQEAAYALSLDPDNTTFWIGDEVNGTIWHLDIATGNVLGSFDSQEIDGFVEGVSVAGKLVASPLPRKAQSSCDLLSTREIAKAVDKPVSAGYLATGSTLCVFEAGAPAAAVKALLQSSGGKRAFTAAKKVAHGRAVAGIGTQAFFGKTAGEQVVGVLEGAKYVFVSSIGIAGSRTKAGLTKLAKLAVKRA